MSQDLRTEEKAYAYVVRENGAGPEVLCFREAAADGVQVPKGTVEPTETPREAVVREVHEETGIAGVEAVEPVGSDRWPHRTKPKVYHRHFFRLHVDEDRDRWRHTVIGGGDDHGDVYECFFADPDAVDLVADMDAFIDRAV